MGESPLLASSFARGLSDSVNLKRSSSCSFACEIKKEPTVSFQNDWLRWQQKTAGSICYCLPSLYCIQLLLGFVSIFKGKKPFYIYEFETLKNGVWAAKSPIKSGFLPGTSFSYPFDGPSGEIRTPGILNPNQAPYQLGHTRMPVGHYTPSVGKLQPENVWF